MSQASPGTGNHSVMTSRDVLADDAVSIHSFETVLPQYSEATLPSYTPRVTSSTRINATSSRTPGVSRLPPVRQPQILSISQSNLPLRFTAPRSLPAQTWSPKVVYPALSTHKRRPESNAFARGRRPIGEALAHGDTSEIPIRRTSPPRMTPGRSTTFDEEVRIRELDELTRAISLENQPNRNSPRAVPQIPGSLRRESRLLGDEWDNLAVEAQKEEIIIRISEFETQFEDRQTLPYAVSSSLHKEIASLQVMLSMRRDDVSMILAGQAARIRELRESGTRVSHIQKDQMKNDMVAMKAEITFLDEQAADLEKLARKVEEDDVRHENGNAALEDDNKNWDLWFEATGHR